MTNSWKEEIVEKHAKSNPKAKKRSPTTVKDRDTHPTSLTVRTRKNGEYLQNLKFVASSNKQNPTNSESTPFTKSNQTFINSPSTQSFVHENPLIEENSEAEMSDEEHEEGKETIKFQLPSSSQLFNHPNNQVSPNQTARLLNFSDDYEPDVAQLPSITRKRSRRKVKKHQKLDHRNSN
jgi:hypothetical protein